MFAFCVPYTNSKKKILSVSSELESAHSFLLMTSDELDSDKVSMWISVRIRLHERSFEHNQTDGNSGSAAFNGPQRQVD